MLAGRAESLEDEVLMIWPRKRDARDKAEKPKTRSHSLEEGLAPSSSILTEICKMETAARSGRNESPLGTEGPGYKPQLCVFWLYGQGSHPVSVSLILGPCG